MKKRFLSLMLVLAMVAGICPAALAEGASEKSLPVSADTLLAMDQAELLDALLSHGLELPEDFNEHREIAETFVGDYAQLLLEGKVDGDDEPFSYSQSNEMLHNLSAALEGMGYSIQKNGQRTATYTLQNSTPIGSWSDDYLNYNCYGYAINRHGKYNPGSLSGNFFSLAMSVSEIAELTLCDLDKIGYWGYATVTRPTSLPDKYFKVICVRKNLDNKDFHYMKPYGTSLYSWAHKPSTTQPLKWNYPSPNEMYWTNECIKNGVVEAPTVIYDSDIYYIIYKGKDDPGITFRNMSDLEIEALITG